MTWLGYDPDPHRPRCTCIPAYTDRDYWHGSMCEECERRAEGDEQDARNEAHARDAEWDDAQDAETEERCG